MTRKIEGDNVLFFDGEKQILGIYPVMKDEDNTVNVSLDGDIRRELATMFQDEVASYLSAMVNVVLDFNKVTYISYSAMIGLLELQHVAEKDKIDLKLKNLTTIVREKFETTGFNQLLEIE